MKPVVAENLFPIYNDRFSTTKGYASLSWPVEMTDQDLADIEEWLHLVLRKIRRQNSQPADEGGN